MSQSLPPVSNVVNFVVLLAFLIYVLRKPASTFLQARSKKFEDNLRESDELRAQALAMLATYEDKMAKLDQEVEAILRKAEKDGEAEKEKILKRAQLLAQQIVDNAKRNLAREAQGIRKNIEKQCMQSALAQAKQDIVKKVSQTEHEQFVDHFLTQMEAEHGINR